MEKYIKWISDEYDQMYVAELIDDAILDYVDPDWEKDGYEDEFAYYWDHSNHEAEDDVIDFLTKKIEEKFDVKFGYAEVIELYDLLMAEFEIN